MPLPHVVASQHPPPPPPQPAQGNIFITRYLYDNDHWTAITVNPFDAHCCHMCTAILCHPVPDRVKLSFVIFDIRALWPLGLFIFGLTLPFWKTFQRSWKLMNNSWKIDQMKMQKSGSEESSGTKRCWYIADFRWQFKSQNKACKYSCSSCNCMLYYPRDAMLARVIVIATCPSVRLSITRWYCVKTKKASDMISSPSGKAPRL